jgi:hypothetical protein
MAVPDTTKEAITMAKYLLLKHYRGGPTPIVENGGLQGASPEDYQAHIAFMGRINEMLQESGEFVDAQGLAPTGTFVRYGGPDAAPVTDGPFAETKDLIAGWYVIDVDGWDRAVELATELSMAPGKDGKPIHEWLEVRPFYGSPTATEG